MAPRLDWLWPAADLPAIAPPPPWMADGLCQEYLDVAFFPERGQPAAPAKEVCGRCLVQAECLRYVLAESEDPGGIWGGTSPQERRVLRRPRNRQTELDERAARDEEIIRLHAEGFSLREIGRQVGISYSAVRAALMAAGRSTTRTAA